MAEHNNLGKKGEDAAVKHLLQNNYQIINCNWRYRNYEVDIIARQDDTIIFIEVKTRSGSLWGYPEEAISKSRIKRLVDAADYYIQANDITSDIRFDVIAIIADNNTLEIEHFENAFYAPVQ